MNKDLVAAAKFKRIANVIFLMFVGLTLILPPIFAYMFYNYWLLFGIAFSLIGYSTKNKNLKPEKILFLVTIMIVIYWFNVGFHFSDLITFFWLSYLFGNIFKAFVMGYEDLSKKIIDMKASEMTSSIISGLKYRQKTMDKKEDDEIK